LPPDELGAEFTAGRENGHRRHRRPKGYADWRPQRKTRELLGQVRQVLDEYSEQLPLTVRQIFYRLVGAHGYDKTERAYERLAEHLVRARRARLIAFDHIRDDGIVVYPFTWYAGIDDFEDEVAARKRGYRRHRQLGQPQYIELWCEAAGMAPQLARVAHPFSVPVYSAGGFASLSAVRNIVDRAVERSVPTVLLHVGDLDPSGESIFDAMGTDAAAFVEADRQIMPQRIEPVRVALTVDQVEEYELPTAPPKRSDSRSRNWRGETCQLEALPPDVLGDIVRSAIVDRLDQGKLAEQLDVERLERATLLGLPPGASSDD
jgi:hypothetical protein